MSPLPHHTHTHPPPAQRAYHVSVALLDVAASYVHNVAFVHWRATLKPHGGGDGKEEVSASCPMSNH